MYPPPHMTCTWSRSLPHLSSSSYDMYPPPHMTCTWSRSYILLIILSLLVWVWLLLATPQHRALPPRRYLRLVLTPCILLLIWHVSSSSFDMYLVQVLTPFILVLIWHISSSSYDMYLVQVLTPCTHDPILFITLLLRSDIRNTLGTH
jgi:hypothetical protein